MRPPLVIAHRGASWDEPENTLPAFERAIAEGADYVEFDVRAAPDGQVVVTHDPVRQPPGPEVPTLDEALACCSGRVGVALEIKEGRVTEASLVALERHGVDPDALMVLSGAARTLEQVRRRRPGLRTVLNLGPRPDPAAAAGCWGVGLRKRRAGPRRIARAARLGLATVVYTVNDPARMRALARLGVTAIVTDRPGLLRSTLQLPDD